MIELYILMPLGLSFMAFVAWLGGTVSHFVPEKIRDKVETEDRYIKGYNNKIIDLFLSKCEDEFEEYFGRDIYNSISKTDFVEDVYMPLKEDGYYTISITPIEESATTIYNEDCMKKVSTS